MNNELIQKTLKEEIDKFKLNTTDYLKMIEDYGCICTTITEKKIEICWWKFRISESIYHFVFKTSKRTFLILHKPFLDGFKITNEKIESMSEIELSEYD